MLFSVADHFGGARGKVRTLAFGSMFSSRVLRSLFRKIADGKSESLKNYFVTRSDSIM